MKLWKSFTITLLFILIFLNIPSPPHVTVKDLSTTTDITLSTTVKIQPKRTTVKKLTPVINGVKVEWEYRQSQTTGYELQYSTSKSFKKATTIVIKEKETTTKTIENLQGNKIYYIRMCTYKEIEGKRYCSKWSKTCKVTTGRKKISVPYISQNPELPTGCEATSAAMVLQYYGENINHTTLAKNWISKSSDFYWKDGKKYGPDPNEIFVGDPFTKYSYGCFAPVIANAVNNNSELCFAEVLKEKSLSYLCKKYIDNGKPLLIWATIGMVATQDGDTWYIENGEKYVWSANEHCLVLIDYDDDCYYFNDPLKGEKMAYSKALVEQRYNEQGSQAVYIDLIK